MIKDNTPLVSIIMPTYNSSGTVALSIESIVNQTFRDWELIITDDFSKDDTVNILSHWKKRDNRIKVLRFENNLGAGAARNNSIIQAKGRFIAFCDSDDLWSRNKLEVQIDFMLTNQVLFSFSSYDIIDEEGDFLKHVIARQRIQYLDLLKNNYIGCLTVVYDSKFLGKRTFAHIRKRQDWLLWLEILKDVDFAYGINQSLAYYRKGKSTISSNKFSLIKYSWIVYYKKLDFGILKSVKHILMFMFYLIEKKIK